MSPGLRIYGYLKADPVGVHRMPDNRAAVIISRDHLLCTPRHVATLNRMM
jgi:hypothetical protein